MSNPWILLVFLTPPVLLDQVPTTQAEPASTINVSLHLLQLRKCPQRSSQS